MKKKQIITKIISVGLAAGITLFGTSFFNGSKIVQADQVANGKTIIIDAGHCGGLSSGYDVGALCPTYTYHICYPLQPRKLQSYLLHSPPPQPAHR